MLHRRSESCDSETEPVSMPLEDPTDNSLDGGAIFCTVKCVMVSIDWYQLTFPARSHTVSTGNVFLPRSTTSSGGYQRVIVPVFLLPGFHREISRFWVIKMHNVDALLLKIVRNCIKFAHFGRCFPLLGNQKKKQWIVRSYLSLKALSSPCSSSIWMSFSSWAVVETHFFLPTVSLFLA